MSGKYGGLQQLVRNKNPRAAWIPCVAHSLNLVGKTAAECCPKSVAFFDIIQTVYTFLTGSPSRLERLKKHVRLVSKNLSDTLWSCRADGLLALVLGYDGFVNTLKEIAADTQLPPLTRERACGLRSINLGSLDFGFYKLCYGTTYCKYLIAQA